MRGLRSFAPAVMLCGLAHPADAEPALPVGTWDNLFRGKPICDRPSIRIEPRRIIERLDEGEGRCRITSLKQKGRALSGEYACDWDASVPQGLRERPDGDDNGFSLTIKAPDRILYNNTLLGRCPSTTGRSL